MEYFEGNRDLFDAGVYALPGVSLMRLDGTYLESGARRVFASGRC
ncbi:bifunctional pyridoxal-dependent enzyme with beta-cystathionase and maltose regulon repressor activities [Mycoplana sp. BE70]|nr:hypothetical protein [Mycoplana sp. BE70]MDR6759111.1 bifunctional pyridoxal-dependent enzyme with beta-cystathionase and maltose regulon repressor activities [Mycoplana sp. BE70]